MNLFISLSPSLSSFVFSSKHESFARRLSWRIASLIMKLRGTVESGGWESEDVLIFAKNVTVLIMSTAPAPARVSQHASEQARLEA